VDQDLFNRIKKCAVEVLSVEESAVVPDAKFGDDLDADSLDLVELVMALEEEFGVEVPEEDLEGVETVGQAYEWSSASSEGRALTRPRRPGTMAPGTMIAARSRRRSTDGRQGTARRSHRVRHRRPCGIGRDAFWNGLLGPGLTDTKVSTVDNWDPSPWFDNPKEARRADRVEQFAVAAAAEAFAQAGDVGVDAERFGTIFASGIGGLQTLEDQVQIRLEKG
jgi:acyl carrier protein